MKPIKKEIERAKEERKDGGVGENYVRLMQMLGLDRDFGSETLTDAIKAIKENRFTGPAFEKAVEKVSPFIFENYRPYAYPTMGNIISDTVSAISGTRAKPERDSKGRLTAAEEAWARSLGQEVDPYYFQDSEFAPGRSEDKDAKYFRLNRDMIDVDRLIDAASKAELGEGDSAVLGSLYDILGFNVSESDLGPDPLENYTIGMGRDDRGRYISYYDKYDFSGPANEVIQPFEIYDRFYIDEPRPPRQEQPKRNLGFTKSKVVKYPK